MELKKAAIYTLGCKVNQYETQAIKERFIENGYEIVDENTFADVYVINTCTVTNLSDRKSRQFIRRAKRFNPDSIIVVTGCYAQVSPEEVEAIEEVNLVVGTNEKNRIVEYVEELENQDKMVVVKDRNDIIEYEDMQITGMDTRTRAYIKIQEGCNQFCSYCIIPYARGNVRSRKLEDIIQEAEGIIKNGHKEIVLTGINAALYGKDLSEEKTLLNVIEGINNIKGKFRIRLSSIEPAVLDDSFIDELMSFDKLCPHIHLSLQSGSDKILKLMNRKYTTSQYAHIVKTLRKKRNNMNFTTDIIVGFPYETEEDFKNTCEFVSRIQFGKVHVFKYSKRKGTKASEMEEQVDPSIKSKRSDRLIHLSDQVAKEYNMKNINSYQEVLFEIKNERGYYEGFTDNYIKVYCESDVDLTDEFATIYITDIFEDGLTGKFVNFS